MLPETRSHATASTTNHVLRLDPKGRSFFGQHPAIVTAEMFEAVQALL
jgi:hypothetical protein